MLQRPAPSAGIEGEVRRVDASEWALQDPSPLPDTIGWTPAPSNSAWERLLRDAIRERGEEVEVSVEINCVAREIGRTRYPSAHPRGRFFSRHPPSQVPLRRVSNAPNPPSRDRLGAFETHPPPLHTPAAGLEPEPYASSLTP